MSRKLEQKIKELEKRIDNLGENSGQQQAPSHITNDLDELRRKINNVDAAVGSLTQQITEHTKTISEQANNTTGETFDPQIEDRIKGSETLLQDMDAEMKKIKADLPGMKRRLTNLEKKK